MTTATGAATAGAPARALDALEERFRRLGALGDAQGILHWDAETMMPRGAAPGRAEQLAALARLSHELLVDPAVGDLIAQAEQEVAADGAIDPWRQANLREIRRTWLHASAVPADLVEASSRAVSACEIAWRDARARADFPALLPSLRTVLDRQRDIAAAKAEALGLDPYDALLDGYEPGARAAEIDRVFARLEAALPGLIARVVEHQRQQPAPLPLSGPFPVESQRALGQRMMAAVGFDAERGRLDVSLHPFCGGASDDVRITTRYDEADFTGALMGVLHETGHALYEQGRPGAWLHQPVGAARGMAMHESQSLLIEMQACRGDAFIRHAAPILRETFGGSGPAWDSSNLIRLYRRVAPGFIRVDADEVTYPVHVILRYRLERALIAGSLDLADLPAAWNEGMGAMLGIVPPDDARGCLQDIHWPGGAWGYFPTYTLGAMMAAQLFDAACRADAAIPDGLANGDFAPLVAWLRTHVHGLASSRSGAEILTAATGRPLDPAIYLAHLERRYLA